MKPWSVQSISGRLTALVVVVSGTALLLAYMSYLAYDFYTLRHNLIESIDSQANLIGINSETALLFDDQQAAESTLSARRAVHLDCRDFPSQRQPLRSLHPQRVSSKPFHCAQTSSRPALRILDSER